MDNLKFEMSTNSSRGGALKAKKPKRNISAFHIFSKELHAEFNQATERVNPNKRMAIISERWQNLPDKVKLTYSEKAKMDKWRYLNELNEFLEGGQEAELKKKPKKFGNAFTFYLRDKKEQVRHEYPELSMAEIMSVIAKKWKEASPAEKQKYNKISEADKLRYKQEIEDLEENSAPMKVNKKVKLLKNAQKLEKTIDELIQNSLEKTNTKINEFKEKMTSKPTEQSTMIFDEFSKTIKAPLELLRSNVADQSSRSSNYVKNEHIDEEPVMNFVQTKPSLEFWHPARFAVNRQDSFPLPQLESHQNSFERIKITYPSLDYRNPSVKKESVFYLRDFPNLSQNNINNNCENFLERKKSDFYADFAKKDQRNDALNRNDSYFSLFGDLGNTNNNNLAPEESKNVSTTNESHSSGYGTTTHDPMAIEERSEDVIRRNENGRRFNSVIADAITMDSSLFGSGEYFAFDTFN